MTSPMIEVEDLGKRYLRCGQQRAISDLRERLVGFVTKPFRRKSESENREFWALRNVSFSVERGEVMGIIGRNGAGKSTLLKILSRITRPTEGRADMNGRVGSLLEVGTGFHPELTGRENVYFSGAILGMKETEIKSQFDAIVDFSGVEESLDTPVKHYSSGMRVRLGFAVAAHLNPEILLVDEVLAVGDAAFQKKCLGKMDEVARQGRTVLFVSHNMGAVSRLCHSAVLLDRGITIYRGPSAEVVEKHMALSTGTGHVSRCDFAADPGRPMCLRSVEVLDSDDRSSEHFEMREPLRIKVKYDVNTPVTGAHVICYVFTVDGVNVLGSGDADCAPERLETRQAGQYCGTFEIPAFLLGEGRYSISVSLGIPFVKNHDSRVHCLSFAVTDHRSTQRGCWLHRRRPGVLGIELPWSYRQWGSEDRITEESHVDHDKRRASE